MEMSEKVSIGEVLQSGGVVRHVVAVSWEEVSEVTVAVEALVIAGVPAEGGGGTTGGDGAFPHAGHSRGVVREVLEGGIPCVVGG